MSPSSAIPAVKASQWYDGIPSEQYHAGPGVSSSELKIITAQSPLHFHARRPKKRTPAMLLGEVLHAYVLEPETVCDRFLFAPDLKLNTKAGKEAMATLQEDAESTGRVVVRENPDYLQAIADAVCSHGAWKHLTGPAPVFERSFYWNDEATGTLLKCRPDCLNLDFGEKSGLIVDLKSTVDARDRAFTRQVVDLGYDFSAAFYCAGVEAVTGKPCGWAWFTFEKTPPYATRVIIAGPAWLARGRKLYRRALDKLAECQKSGNWPGLDAGKAVELPFPRWADLDREVTAQEA